MVILSNQKLKIAKYRFWLQKEVKNSIPSNFLIRDLNIVASFICYFWFITILSSEKLKNAKYRFGLQKGVKNSIQQDFLIRDPQIVGSFICYFCLNMAGTWIFFGGVFSAEKHPPKRFEICNFQAESFGPIIQLSPASGNVFEYFYKEIKYKMNQFYFFRWIG